MKLLSSLTIATAILAFAPLSFAGDHGHEHSHDNSSAAAKPEVKITSNEVASGIYMMMGQGGNITVSIGEDGTFLVDDQYAPMSEKISAAIKNAGGDTPRFLLNTHWHGDHTGGNKAFGEQGTIIVAHENVRKRLTSDQFVKAFNMKSGPQPKAALPVITFTDGINFHWNNNTVEAHHVANAHTDSDSYVYFKESNVVSTGDLYFAGFYPFIDPDSKGSLAGMIAGVTEILAFINNETKVIPGHGPLSNKNELTAYRDMLQNVYDRIKALKEDGKSLDEIIAAKPTEDFDDQWADGIFTADKWISIIYPTI
ncbi:MAG: MBL fold metallo-hydrolase [Oceanobacter sp.]|nr:MAG: MBL fold metallo-hydrolase [Oceanobacter sp.]